MPRSIITLNHPEFNNWLQKSSQTIQFYKTPAGILKLSIIDNAIYSASFIDDQRAEISQDIPNTLLLIGSSFQCKVWKALLTIPEGKTISYKELAQQLGIPKAARAVANALAQNSIAYFIPCHRIICSNRTLGGYKWGIEKKAALLKSESL